MPKKLVTTARSLQEPGRKVAVAILDFIGEVPSSAARKSADPASRAREIAGASATKAALTAGSLALPPGPLGWITILPEMIAVRKLQAQMVADIGASYGKDACLSREQMLYCLFRHTAAQAVRDVVVRVGERVAESFQFAAQEARGEREGLYYMGNACAQTQGHRYSRYLTLSAAVRLRRPPIPRAGHQRSTYGFSSCV